MAYTIRPVEYYYVNVRDELGAAYRVLSALAARGVSLLAFTAVPSGPSLAQFALFPGGAEQARRRGAGSPDRARRPASRAARPRRRRAGSSGGGARAALRGGSGRVRVVGCD